MRAHPRSVVITLAGPLNNVIKIKPPIVFNKHNADQMLREVDHALTALGAKAHL